MIQGVEITATLLGLVQGILVMLNRRSNWIFYCLQMAALTVYSWMVGLYGDFMNNVAYLFLGSFAYVLWGKESARRITSSSVRVMFMYSIVTIASTVLLHYFLVLTDDPLPLVDAVSTTTSLLATILMTFRRLECWIVWLGNDLLYCVEYYMLPNQATYLMFLNAVWSIMALVSLIVWTSSLKSKRQ